MGKLAKIFVAIAAALNLHQLVAYTKERITDPGQAKAHGTFNIRLSNVASTVSSTATLQDMVIGLERKVVSPAAAPLAEWRDDKPPR